LLVLAVVLAVMAIGVLGSVLPVLPGAPIIFAAMLAYGYYEHFQVMDISFLVTMLLLALFTLLLDYLAGAFGAKKFGATRAGVTGGIVGGLAGILLFPPWGLLVGPFLGAVFGELVTGMPIDKAVKAGYCTVLGVLGGNVMRLIVAVVMVVMFLVRVF
jgi:uncharacterized protein YqgC (DUF456 family)